MKEKKMADKIAEKTFHSDVIQKSWQAHIATFGPILEPAFAEDFQSRVHLTAALNLISNRNFKNGVEKLRTLEEKCVTDADKAAWHIFMAVAAEMSSSTTAAMDHYSRAGEYGHKFYLPYFKLARFYHFSADFDRAEGYYWNAASCLESQPPTDKKAGALSSVYSNISSCLTMMHRYDDALVALERSKAAADRNPSRLATEAILYAAMGEGEKVDTVLEAIRKQAPGLLEPTTEMTQQILTGTHAHFSNVEVEEEKIVAFWEWFCSGQITGETLSAELIKVFAFMQRPLQVRLEEKNIQFRDNYVTALSEGYRKLLAACPEDIKAVWEFEIIH